MITINANGGTTETSSFVELSTSMTTTLQEEGQEQPQPQCSYNYTGQRLFLQDIYRCEDCSSSSDVEHVCFCDTCASTCHDLCKNVIYLGMAPAYCDCRVLGSCQCNTHTSSSTNTSSNTTNSVLQIEGVGLGETNTCHVAGYRCHSTNSHPFPALLDTYTMHNNNTNSSTMNNDVLVSEALELVVHTAETHWLPISDDTTTACDNNRSMLETLAHNIARQHSLTYGIPVDGCEWWVQVKHHCSNSTIAMHYDKDETLAEVCGLGAFPVLSTVTYLTSHSHTPTIIVNKRYSQDMGEGCSDVVYSFPVSGKHIVFDGTLLHGAPSNSVSYVSSHDMYEDTVRITFLVNIWGKGRRPSGVQEMSEDIRQKILSAHLNKDTMNISTCLTDSTKTNMHHITVSGDSIDCYKEGNILELPFVEENEGEDDDKMTLGVPRIDMSIASGSDTIHVHFDSPQIYIIGSGDERSKEEEKEVF